MSDLERLGNLFPQSLRENRSLPAQPSAATRTPYPFGRIYQPDVLLDKTQNEKPRQEGIHRSAPGRQNRTARQPGHLGRAATRLSQPACPVCKDRRYLRRDLPFGHPDFGKLVECACLLRMKRVQQQDRLLALARLSTEERERTLATFHPQVKGVQTAVKAARAGIAMLGEWAQHRQERQQTAELRGEGSNPPAVWIVFMGPVGVGKTHLALAIANASIDAGIVTLFSTVPDLLDHLRATFPPDAPVAYSALFEQMRSAELLVLDDLGAQRSSPWADEKLFQLLNHRYSLRWPTIITLNRKVWTYLDERLQSRLSDLDLVQLIEMDEAHDYRKRQGKHAPTEKQDVNVHE